MAAVALSGKAVRDERRFSNSTNSNRRNGGDGGGVGGIGDGGGVGGIGDGGGVGGIGDGGGVGGIGDGGDVKDSSKAAAGVFHSERASDDNLKSVFSSSPSPAVWCQSSSSSSSSSSVSNPSLGASSALPSLSEQFARAVTARKAAAVKAKEEGEKKEGRTRRKTQNEDFMDGDEEEEEEKKERGDREGVEGEKKSSARRGGEKKIVGDDASSSKRHRRLAENCPLDFEYAELRPSSILSLTASLTPFSNHNQSPRCEGCVKFVNPTITISAVTMMTVMILILVL